MEGLRSLQQYEDEASKGGATPPRAETLRQRLDGAATYLAECVTTYPQDLLPRYYYGTVLALQAQVEGARQLRDDVTNKRQQPSPAPKAVDLYRRAAYQFEQ